MFDSKKYIFVFILTAVIFFFAFEISNYFADKKIESIKYTEQAISTDILSIETQYELLQDSSCSIVNGSTLSDELSNLGDKLSFTEAEEGDTNPNVHNLKQYYSLLEIKDYLLVKQISRKCHTSPVFILYFYSNQGDCAACTRQGYVLTELRAQYPSVRIYAFDYNLGLSAIDTLTRLYHIKKPLPALVIDGKVYQGFQSMDDIKKNDPHILLMSTASSTNTNAQATTSSSTSR